MKLKKKRGKESLLVQLKRSCIYILKVNEGVFRACPTTVSSGYEGKWEDGTAR